MVDYIRGEDRRERVRPREPWVTPARERRISLSNSGRPWVVRVGFAAICHGVLVLARAQRKGRSLLHDRRTTCLPKYLERLAYYSTAWKLGRYYRTYDAYVEDEVRAALGEPTSQFRRGPINLGSRDSHGDFSASFLVEHENYLSARWPGDAYAFAHRFAEMLQA